MTAGKTSRIILILFGAPTLAFWMQDLRGAGNTITPYLWSAFYTASIISVLTLLFFKHKEGSNIWKLIRNCWISIAVFFLISGPLVVIAENFAAYRWELSGEPLGDHGSYHEFYPGDSGMAHHPTKFTEIFLYGLLSSIFWMPTSALLIWITTKASSLIAISMKTTKMDNKAQ